MYKITESTDKKFVGKEVELTSPPLMLGTHPFRYEKVVVSGEDLIVSNSNYVIYLTKI